MPMQVVNGAQLACSFGSTPASLVVLPANRAQAANQPKATVQDHAPMLNIMPFGMCLSPSNPQVAAATAAALGVLTPQPCSPATTAAWTPGAVTIEIGDLVALDDLSMCTCTWGGMVTITDPGEATVQIP